MERGHGQAELESAKKRFVGKLKGSGKVAPNAQAAAKRNALASAAERRLGALPSRNSTTDRSITETDENKWTARQRAYADQHGLSSKATGTGKQHNGHEAIAQTANQKIEAAAGGNVPKSPVSTNKKRPGFGRSLMPVSSVEAAGKGSKIDELKTALIRNKERYNAGHSAKFR